LTHYILLAGIIISSTGQLSVIGTAGTSYKDDMTAARPVSQFGTQYIVVADTLFPPNQNDSFADPYVIAVMATEPSRQK
jgi:hypothetical protein